MRPTDDELRARYAELRESEQADAPDFHAMWTAAATQRQRVWRPTLIWTAAAAAAAAAAVLAVSVGLRFTRARNVVLDPTVAISTWRSPTESLLRTSRAAVLVQPTILGSVLDGALGATTGGMK